MSDETVNALVNLGIEGGAFLMSVGAIIMLLISIVVIMSGLTMAIPSVPESYKFEGVVTSVKADIKSNGTTILYYSVRFVDHKGVNRLVTVESFTDLNVGDKLRMEYGINKSPLTATVCCNSSRRSSGILVILFGLAMLAFAYVQWQFRNNKVLDLFASGEFLFR